MPTIRLDCMLQEIITFGIIAITVAIIGYRIYTKIWGKPKPSGKCHGCSGCGAIKPTAHSAGHECNPEVVEQKVVSDEVYSNGAGKKIG